MKIKTWLSLICYLIALSAFAPGVSAENYNLTFYLQVKELEPNIDQVRIQCEAYGNLFGVIGQKEVFFPVPPNGDVSGGKVILFSAESWADPGDFYAIGCSLSFMNGPSIIWPTPGGGTCFTAGQCSKTRTSYKTWLEFPGPADPPVSPPE